MYDKRLTDKVSQEVGQHQLRMGLLERRTQELIADNQRLEQQVADFDRVVVPNRRASTIRERCSRTFSVWKPTTRNCAPSWHPPTLWRTDRLRDAEQTWREDRTLLLQENEVLNKQLASFHISAFERDRLEYVNGALQSTQRRKGRGRAAPRAGGGVRSGPRASPSAVHQDGRQYSRARRPSQ